MSEKETAIQLIESVPPDKLGYAIAYLQGLIAGEPNETTYEAMEAAEQDDSLFGPFESVRALMEALNA